MKLWFVLMLMSCHLSSAVVRHFICSSNLKLIWVWVWVWIRLFNIIRYISQTIFFSPSSLLPLMMAPLWLCHCITSASSWRTELPPIDPVFLIWTITSTYWNDWAYKILFSLHIHMKKYTFWTILPPMSTVSNVCHWFYLKLLIYTW